MQTVPWWTRPCIMRQPSPRRYGTAPATEPGALATRANRTGDVPHQIKIRTSRERMLTRRCQNWSIGMFWSDRGEPTTEAHTQRSGSTGSRTELTPCDRPWTQVRRASPPIWMALSGPLCGRGRAQGPFCRLWRASAIAQAVGWLLADPTRPVDAQAGSVALGPRVPGLPGGQLAGPNAPHTS